MCSLLKHRDAQIGHAKHTWICPLISNNSSIFMYKQALFTNFQVFYFHSFLHAPLQLSSQKCPMPPTSFFIYVLLLKCTHSPKLPQHLSGFPAPLNTVHDPSFPCIYGGLVQHLFSATKLTELKAIARQRDFKNRVLHQQSLKKNISLSESCRKNYPVSERQFPRLFKGQFSLGVKKRQSKEEQASGCSSYFFFVVVVVRGTYPFRTIKVCTYFFVQRGRRCGLL